MSEKKNTVQRTNSKPGPRQLPEYSDAVLLKAARSLHGFLGLTVESGNLDAGNSQRLRETLSFWLDALDSARQMTEALVLCSVLLVRGYDVEEQLWVAEQVRRDGKKISRRAVKTALDRGGKTDIGRAYSVFKVLAKGARCTPTFGAYNAPRGELRDIFLKTLR